MDAIRLLDAELVSIQVNTFRGVRYALRTQDATRINLVRAVADSVSGLVLAEGLDTLTLTSDTVRVAASLCLSYPTNVTVGGVVVPHTDPSSFIVTSSSFDHCAAFSGGVGLSVQPGTGGTPDLTISRSTIVTPRNAVALFFRGGDLSLDSNTISASTVPVDTARFGTFGLAGVEIDEAVTTNLSRNTITEFRRGPGATLAATNDLRFGANRITRNGVGFRYVGDGNFNPTATISSCSLCGGQGQNDVYDNDTLGFRGVGGVSGTFPDSIWWGDARGPRSGGFAAGDSVATFGVVTLTSADPPRYPGSSAAGLRLVRGNNGIASAGAALLPQLTVRVVDADGRPVSGVSVTFTVTGGGGNFAGPTSVNVVSNADGLVEANLTLGPTPGTNTVTATGTTQALGTVTFTATGT
jgi:hypothetical protein